MVTTPQLAAAEVAERAGAIALQTSQRIVGVVENMSGLPMPDGTTMQIFGEGGGRQVAERLPVRSAPTLPLLGQVPLDPRARIGRRRRSCRWCCRRRIRRRARSCARSPTRCRAASVGWPGCRSASIQPAANPGISISATRRDGIIRRDGL